MTPEKAFAWLQAHATLGSKEADMVLSIWSGFLYEQDAWEKKFPGFKFDPETVSIIEK